MYIKNNYFRAIFERNTLLKRYFSRKSMRLLMRYFSYTHRCIKFS